MKTRQDLIEAVLGMNYGELKSICCELAEMIDKDVRPKVETTEEFADLLYDWAEAQDEANGG